MANFGKFKLLVIDPDKVIFEGEVSSVFLPGDKGEFEILPYHYPLISLLREGEIVIDGKYAVPINHGIVRFFKNECVILVQVNEMAFINL
ncbi:MAG: hypothetical protein B6D56_05155 [Candidatus Omnitrophica bacterium 4484_70.1]|nr:MAG: hypothetical protein B6D56_05155 [Candidatus Omnitrophica bacterium 4484_70.1]